MKRIASFSVDHDKLRKGMYISRIDGDVVTYDIRMKVPNKGDYLGNGAMHTFEHLFATYARNSAYSDQVIYIGPMGCRTGFYFLVRDTLPHEEALKLVRESFAFIRAFEGEIPGAKRRECGNYREHDLEGARAAAAEMCEVLRDWTAEKMQYESSDAGSQPDKRPVGLICAMDIEIADLMQSLDHSRRIERAGYTFHTGVIGEQPVVLVKCGVGKVNAARGTQMLIDLFAPEAIINSGIAGGTEEGLQIGDIIIGVDFVQHDFDTTAFGYARGYMCTGVAPEKPTFYHADPDLVRELRAAAESYAESERSAEAGSPGARSVREGRIASGDQFIASAEAKSVIAEAFGAAAAEMESAAIAQTAESAGVPFAVLRVTSDLADGTAPENYQEFEKLSADLSAAVILRFLENREN